MPTLSNQELLSSSPLPPLSFHYNFESLLQLKNAKISPRPSSSLKSYAIPDDIVSGGTADDIALYQPVDLVILKSLLARCHPPVNVCALGSPQTVTWSIHKVAKDLLPCKSLANIQVDSSWRITWSQSGCRAIALKGSQNLLRLPSKDNVPSTKNDPHCGRLVPIRTFGPLAPLC